MKPRFQRLAVWVGRNPGALPQAANDAAPLARRHNNQRRFVNRRTLKRLEIFDFSSGSGGFGGKSWVLKANRKSKIQRRFVNRRTLMRPILRDPIQSAKFR
jgi:hypothetical protein